MTTSHSTFRPFLLLLLILFALSPLPQASAHGDHGHGHEHDDHDVDHDDHDEHRTTVQIEPVLAAKSGITTAQAQSGELEMTRRLYGQLVADPRQVAKVQARFPGPVVRLNVALGDKIKAGEVLADVEANESLRRYSITAPISGTLIELDTNVGSVAGEQPLMVIANYQTLLAEFRVYGSDQPLIATGQRLHVRQHGHDLESRIERLLPANTNQPYVRVQARLNNDSLHWLPGQWVEADLVLETRHVDLLVDNRALQQIEDDTVVFVQKGNLYESRPLQLGQSDGHASEVLAGLQAGEHYVIDNSFLLKADLEKSGAAHEH